MKRSIIVFSTMLVLVALIALLGQTNLAISAEVPQSAEETPSSEVSPEQKPQSISAAPVQTPAPGPDALPETETTEPGPAAADPQELANLWAFTFEVVDHAGGPVADLDGFLFFNAAVSEDGGIRALQGEGDNLSAVLTGTRGGIFTGADGKLHYGDFEALEQFAKSGLPLDECVLLLRSHFDDTIHDTFPVDLSNSPKVFTVVWKQQTPPNKPLEPVYFRITDFDGNPVAGVSGDLLKIIDQDGNNVPAHEVGERTGLVYMNLDLYSTPGSHATGADGILYTTLPSWVADLQDRSFQLELSTDGEGGHSHYYIVTLNDPPLSYHFTWAPERIDSPAEYAGEYEMEGGVVEYGNGSVAQFAGNIHFG